MDLEYDQKFEEMKKYIPFLENMIKRLENTNNGGNNPRKAQLDKIRSLRDLLQDKKKRMKMENLLKCETVLVNLYAKVEQRDASMDNNKESAEKIKNERSDLSVVRSKLKSVTSKLHGEIPETLPEIAGPTNIEVDCTPGSKEPALFQRRPNKASLSPPNESTSSSNDDNLAISKRRYTRVLLSPEPKKKEWTAKADSNNDKPLFSRRSPRRSPRRYSPSFKKERKKSSKRRSKSSQQPKDLNITLKVPEESLSSLNTKDILSRIINCSDSDVDIDTLRGLRSQILGELKQTGAKEDISDLILKSYKNKEKSTKLKTPKKNEEVEEGEISDSESETIENIYGSLVLVNQDDGSVISGKQSKDQQSRKIQICLVINSDKDKDVKVNEQNPNDTFDITEFESFTDEQSVNESNNLSEKTLNKSTTEKSKEKGDKDKSGQGSKNKSPFKMEEKQAKQDKFKTADPIKTKVENEKISHEKVHDTTERKSFANETFKPNFYQPLTEDNSKPEEPIVKDKSCKPNESGVESDVSKLIEIAKNIRASESKSQKRVKKDEVSEMDILQALNKEILGETVPGQISDTIAPPMHQPKVTKVSSAQEIVSKKRISIENYKLKSTPAVKQPLFTPEKYQRTSKDENCKKQSLKLTEKECERFNVPGTLIQDYSSDDDCKLGVSIDDIYSNLAPKSPDHDDFADTGIKPPVIIPCDPVKNVAASSKVDIDMRTKMSVSSPVPFGGRKGMNSSLITKEGIIEKLRGEKGNNIERVESTQLVVNDSSSSYLSNFERLSRIGINYSNVPPDKSPNIASSIPPLMSLKIGSNANRSMSPSITSSINSAMAPILNSNSPLQLNATMASNLAPILNTILTPNMNPSMTPSRNPVMVPGMNTMVIPNPMMTPIMTPNARSYEMTPCQNFDNDDYSSQKHVYAPMFPTFDLQEYSERNSLNMPRWDTNDNRNDRNLRSISVQQDLDHQRHRLEGYKRGNDSPQIRTDCPSTPNPSFGRMETPMTPVHPFSRSDCPMTPSHPFGRADSIMTPKNVYGRDEYHNTSSHKYNQSHDPRLNRSSNYDKFQNRNEERNRSYFKDNRYMSRNNKNYRRFDNSYDRGSRNDRDRMSRRESSVGRSLSKDYDNDITYHGDYYNNDYRSRNEKCKGFDDVKSQRNSRARSIGRMNPSEDSFSPRGENSVSRTVRGGSIEKPISVQSHSGRKFNIDTSFNRTFQESKSTSCNMSFDAQRKRASSVGRCLREPMLEDLEQKTISNTKFKPNVTDFSKPMNFRRASSVGRDLKDYNSNKNLKDIKADLRACKFDNYDTKLRNRGVEDKNSVIINARSNESQSKLDSHSRSRDFDVKQIKKDDSYKYSPNRNFRDPRVRREMNINSIIEKHKNKDRDRASPRNKNYGIVYSNDNIAKGTILASAAGVKNFRIPKIKRPVEENEVKNDNKVSEVTQKEIAVKYDKKVSNTSTTQVTKIENNEAGSESPADKGRNKEKNKEDGIPIAEKTKSKPDCTQISKKQEKKQDQLTELISSDTDSINSFTENSERRITRSVKRGQIKSKDGKESYLKRSKRIKKLVIYDSDSDSQASENMNENVTIHIEENKQMNNKRVSIKEKQVETVDHNEENAEKSSSEKVNESTNELEPAKINDENVKVVDEKKDAIRNQLCEERNESLDISFGADDELFSDNNASGSVLDNIKALIADLDHDIEAPKINDKFINNLISSNDSPIPLEVNETDFVSELLINPKLDFDDVDYSGENDFDIQNVEHGKEKSDAPAFPNKENNVENITSDSTELEKKLENPLRNFNNESIVSTTAFEGKADDVPKESQDISSAHLIRDISFIPDSTINSNEPYNDSNIDNKDSQESIPDSTNEMNSNVTSTHNSTENLPTELSDEKSSSADNLPRIASIGKLLSILEDKNKIKELLTLLDKDSGENEKIKKKLEKLSEIVSDDEESTNVDSKDKSEDSKQPNASDGQNKITDSAQDSSLQSSDRNDSDDCVNKLKIDEVKSSSESLMQDDIGKQIPDMHNIVNNKESSSCSRKITEEINRRKDEEVPQQEEDQSNVLIDSNTVKNIDKDVEESAIEDTSHVHGNVSQETSTELPKKQEDINIEESTRVQSNSEGKTVKKSKCTKKGKFAKNIAQNKRVTRSKVGTSSPLISPAPKKPSRELLKLHEDIREMFISEDVLNATGIRMCRLAKMVDDTNTQTSETEPIVVLEKIKGKNAPVETSRAVDKNNKKKKANVKSFTHSEGSLESESKEKSKCKPGTKSKTKKHQEDPYIFETDSVAESSYTVESKEQNSNSDSDSETDRESVKSFESTEMLVELKKKVKRKRPGWKVGVIRKNNGKKKKSEVKNIETTLPDKPTELCETKKEENEIINKVPDLNCFTDKSYCFDKNVTVFSCRFCGYSGNDIVIHYKKQHPHSEIPLSRLNPATAKEAIEQCEEMNLHAVSKMRTKKYVCRFCFKEFINNNNYTALETFFWHVVSVHTGEYKQLCSECINVTRCPFNLDIPPPPKNLKGQLIGYICGRCHFTQVSLENLKTHVIVRHDDKHTVVYSINLADMSKKTLQSLISKTTNETPVEVPRMLRSSRSNQSVTEQSDDRSDITESTDRVAIDTLRNRIVQDIKNSPNENSENKIQSKFTFENEYMSDTSSYSKNDEIIKAGIKLEHDDNEIHSQLDHSVDNSPEVPNTEKIEPVLAQIETAPYSDVLDYPHFKIKLSGTGSKEYICCINGRENHYKTTLLISLKKHVQMKHSENWDGYCFVCKLIVTSQGVHKFKDCLQHFLDKHMDDFPVLSEVEEPVGQPSVNLKIVTDTTVNDTLGSQPCINVRRLHELISSDEIQGNEGSPAMPKIQNVVSLSSSTDQGGNGPENEMNNQNLDKYEAPQAEIMSKKHPIVLETMLSSEKLIQIFKCSGRFCSYTTNYLEEALVHTSTHQKLGGENSMKCTYCGFDSMGNVIDLVTHVFKTYGHLRYSCSKCFYRAAGSHLVYAHIQRVHSQLDANTVPVLCAPNIPDEKSEDEVMSREEAVLHFICKNKDPATGSNCPYKTFLVPNFRQHLLNNHADDKEYPCYICGVTKKISEALVQHLKNHGLRIYQCCRCLFGAEDEAELLAHASAVHPLKQPKAYVRIISSKVETEVRVLPLATFSKYSVPSTAVTPTAEKDDPVKQVERAIDLENLMGHTNFMIQPVSTVTNAATIEPTDKDEIQLQLESQQTSNSPSNSPHTSTSPAVLTLLKDEQDDSNQFTPVVKNEPGDVQETPDETNISPELTPEKRIPEKVKSPEHDVVCLDSDDDSRQNVIDLSYEEISTEIDQTKTPESDTATVPRSRLFKCPKCTNINKTETTFKKHLLLCYPDKHQTIPCAHCSHTVPWLNIIDHYITMHWTTSSQYTCSLCNGMFASAAGVKRHMKLLHDNVEATTVTNTKDSSLGGTNIIGDGRRQIAKRKLSNEVANVLNVTTNVANASEPAPKLKKYGPEDVDKLPINPILDNLVHCALCEFSTKVQRNMVRHLQLHAEQQPVPRTAPVNPVPHLGTNEKHFDKMVNLASSSVTPKNDKANKDGSGAATEYMSPEAAAIYPKYVPDRHRFTCGAKGCSYISVNESMFKFHWETLHTGTNDYHCVHCPSYQHLDTSKPLSASRIIAHLKMHDTKLYACSLCPYYHHARKLMEKHFKDEHKGKLVIVREDGLEVLPAPTVSQPVTPAPTMDLKPWQCGLCSFKSMLHPEVIEHCGKTHQSKMQFKCTYCGFRTSNIENITKHQSKQHPGKKEEVFYYYYREGSIPDEMDGTARWQKQSQKTEPIANIKIESDVSSPRSTPTLPKEVAKPVVNLDIVKKEVIEPEMNEPIEETVEDLCNAFGQFCDPNGLNYKCSLCKIVIEDSKEAMQSHLYEELQYRKWGCGVCSYKAFHKPGLQQHVQTEHGYRAAAGSREEPIELQMDVRIETWVAKLLEHQTTVIERNKENLVKQKAEIFRATPGPSNAKTDAPVEPPKVVDKPNVSMAELERLFGSFGVPINMNYSCPKCNSTSKSEAVMQEHLESELNKIRWCCNSCTNTFQTYHEAQFHCRSLHQSQPARPVKAARDLGLQAAWVTSVLQVQKLSMNYMPVKETPPGKSIQSSENVDESLLVVRYSERVPTPEEQMMAGKSDSDDDRLVIDEPQPIKPSYLLSCKYCNAVFKVARFFTGHVLKHYGLKLFTCPYCPYNDTRKGMDSHIKLKHPGRSIIYKMTKIPKVPPNEFGMTERSKQYEFTSDSAVLEDMGLVCLVCDRTMTKIEESESFAEYGKKGDVIIKCCHCASVHKNLEALILHHNLDHQKLPLLYSPYALYSNSMVHWCFDCSAKHAFLKYFRSYCNSSHHIPKRYLLSGQNTVEIEAGVKRKADDNTVPIPKRVAKKSTTRLPNVVSVARKSTTKLPFDIPREMEEYSYYGTKPNLDNLENVTMIMPFCNTMVPFSLKKLGEIINIYPIVLVKDIYK